MNECVCAPIFAHGIMYTITVVEHVVDDLCRLYGTAPVSLHV